MPRVVTSPHKWRKLKVYGVTRLSAAVKVILVCVSISRICSFYPWKKNSGEYLIPVLHQNTFYNKSVTHKKIQAQHPSVTLNVLQQTAFWASCNHFSYTVRYKAEKFLFYILPEVSVCRSGFIMKRFSGFQVKGIESHWTSLCSPSFGVFFFVSRLPLLIQGSVA